MARAIMVFVLGILFAIPSAAQQQVIDFEPVATLTGIAQVKDGDGVLFGKVEIRLQGIAAPEDNRNRHDPDGPASSDNLRALVSGKTLTCYFDGTKTRGRPVGVCFLGKVDIGEHQVATGHARDCFRFSKGRYANAEALAQNNGRDLSATYKLPKYCIKR